MKIQLEENYENMVKRNGLEYKTKMLKRLFKRSDYESVISMTFINKNNSK